MWFKAIPD
jgi:hypothetical protein